jgi:hypothetical protein
VAKLGRPVRTIELSAPDGYLSDPELVALRASLRQNLPALLFSAMGADQTRQLRLALASALTSEPTNPTFSTADACRRPADADRPVQQPADLRHLGAESGPREQLPDPGPGRRAPAGLPWQVQRDHPAVMVYPRPLQTGVGSADMARLYALGIDAFRVAREIGRHPVGRFHLDGVTGKLTIDFGQGPAQFERIEQSAIYQNGAPQPLNP